MDNTEDQQMLDSLNLTDIYMKISVSDESNFEERYETKLLSDALSNCFDNKFLMIDSLMLVKDINQLNMTFVKYIKHCQETHNYKRCGKLFISYCDYFDLDYNRCYINLHDKLRELIRKDLIRMVGGLAKFTKIKNKLSPDSITTLFDL